MTNVRSGADVLLIRLMVFSGGSSSPGGGMVTVGGAAKMCPASPWLAHGSESESAVPEERLTCNCEPPGQVSAAEELAAPKMRVARSLKPAGQGSSANEPAGPSVEAANTEMSRGATLLQLSASSLRR